MEDENKLLKQVFGESSESEDSEEHKQPISSSVYDDDSLYASDRNPIWEPIKQINGLWLCRDFLSAPLQATVLSNIQKEGWFTESSNNQAMRFGDLPSWVIELSNSIREVVVFGDQISDSTFSGTADGENAACLLPTNMLWREPLFDQLIVNVYQPGNLCTC